MWVIVEKPIGRAYDSAVELAEGLVKNLQEPKIHCFDNYMDKDGVWVIESFRYANALYKTFRSLMRVCLQ